MNILFTGIGRRVELVQAFREAAMVLKKEIKLFGADMLGTAPALAFCDCFRMVPPMRDANYVDSLLEICVKDAIDLLIPTIDTDLLILSENKSRFREVGTRVLISEPEMIRICRDKNFTSEFFVSCGLRAPLPTNKWEEYKGGYPAFIKPKDGSSSVDAYKVNDETELKTYAKRIKDYVIQPFIDGKEYSLDIFCDWAGNPVTIVPRRRLQVRAGEVLRTRIEMDPQMILEARLLCKTFKPCGPLTVQLIRDEQGIDWYIEINPRFGGGAPLSMKAGAKSAETILKLLDGEEVNEITEIEDGAIYSRFDQSVTVEQGKGSIKGVIFDLDDTLYSEIDYVKSGFRVVSEYLGGDYEKKLWDFFLRKEPAIDKLLNELGRNEEKETVLEVYRNHVPDVKPYEGVREMIAELKKRNVKVGIITDGRPVGQRNKIKALKLEVDDCIITDELGGTQFRKPCDVAFRIMQTRWRLPASQIVYVADNAFKDFQAPKQLGMRSLWLKNPEGLYQGETRENFIENVTEVLDYLENDGMKSLF